MQVLITGLCNYGGIQLEITDYTVSDELFWARYYLNGDSVCTYDNLFKLKLRIAYVNLCTAFDFSCNWLNYKDNL